MSQSFENLLSRFEVAVQQLETFVGSKSSSTSGDSVPPAVTQYQEFLKVHIEPFCKNTSEIDEGLNEVSDLILSGFQTVEKLINAAANGKKPSNDGLKQLLAPVVDILNKIENARGNSRSTPLFDHFSALNEFSKCLQWVGVREITVQFVKEVSDSARFYTDRVLRNFREKEPKVVPWVASIGTVVTALAEYINKFHTSGLRFNVKAEIDALQALNTSSATPAVPAAPAVATASSGAPPPPPGLAPPPVPSSLSRAPAPDMSGIFDAIQGFKTSGLRKVTDDMKTKNRPRDEVSNVVPATTKTTKAAAPAPKTQVSGTPRFELIDEKRWEIYHQNGNREIEISADQCQMNQTLYIFGCVDSLIQVHGKISSIVLDSCSKTALVFHSVVASCEMVNCSNCKLQVNDVSPMVSLNKVDGAQIFLSKKSATSPVYTSKCSEMNLCIMDDDDYEEIPIPELFVTRFNPSTKTLITVPEEI